MLRLLNGIRILDFTTVVLGPYATQILGDLGADVIKVEPLTGDVFRYVRPGRSDSMGANFINCNRNKRSIAIDLATPAGKAAVKKLVAKADVVVHNMRPKSADKLGIGFEDLKAVKPDLVYCYASGFGQEGPNADEPAYDDTIQALCGLAYLNANANGEPRFLPTIVADKVGGLHLAISVLAGLASRNRGDAATCIEAPMYESLVSFLLVEQLAGASYQPPMGGTGYERLRSPYRKPFPTADGFVGIIPYTTTHWIRFFELIGREDMKTDKRVTDPTARSRSIDDLYAMIESATPTRTTDEWLQLLRARDIPCAAVNRLDDLFHDPHLNAVGMFNRFTHPSEGEMLSVRTPFNVTGASGAADLPAPGLSGDAREILDEAGLGDEEIEALFRDGTVAANTKAEGAQ
ncbi:CaiB/BaiF CoA transferase family protein [Pseudokordiimonas caeni]|uniref:CaiB/BaiF CoA transferase family protein n=1 Tax=Pseudokordiimonas caeni TaxID=2997908 RepID=UPI0028112DA0|nr:CoA transferase [Pseudokordiimonas caeni]